MKRPEPRRCLFVPSGQTNHRGVEICEECGCLKTERRHDLPQLAPEAAALRDRIVGEGGQ